MAVRPYLDKVNPDIYRDLGKAAATLRTASEAAGLGRDLIELVNVRVSQINGCPTCLSIHLPAARRAGVNEQVLDILPSWKHEVSGFFSSEQRAALALAEALTRPQPGAETPSVEEAIEKASSVFTEEQLSVLEWAIVFINTYNRISIASGHPPLKKK